MLLTRWNPITIQGREFKVDEIYEGQYEISTTLTDKRKTKNCLKKLIKEALQWDDLPLENRSICEVKVGSKLYMLIEDAKYNMSMPNTELLSA
ncbi:hypothetical protein WKH56_09565 [Priestia sp. SB1]|uniref:Uncharacterized protein n=1 Tax=Priestia aryabhattai TaxID=412384 RepID=A0AAX6NDJ6_PRIAR|nr:hypothetical protein [Priestia aryabhattai]MDU9693806.1 hypothetical protein [Priestia aryabhattai]